MTSLAKVLAASAAAAVLGWPAHPVALAQAPCADLAGVVDGATCRIEASSDTYTFTATFPVDYADPGPVVDYLRQTRDGFVNVSQMPGSRNLPYELDVKATAYRSGEPPAGTQSVVFEIFQDVGGAHPLTWYKSFTYDLDSRAPISYETLFRPDSDPLGVIFPIVEADLRRQTGLTNGFIPGAGTNPSNFQNFAITDDEVLFFFGQGELLPAAAGAVIARVPRTALAPMMTYPGENP